MTNVGIYSVGTFLPEHVRTNDFWSPETVAKWSQHMGSTVDKTAVEAPEEATDAAKYILEGMSEHRGDPFRGARERRVMAPNMKTSDMEVLAARQAIARANIDPKSIDLLLTSTNLPDRLMVANAPLVHQQLGLNEKCFSLQVDAVCNGFQMQLQIAEQMIRGGSAKYALLTQSAATSRLMNTDDPLSGWFGDCATAVIVGPVADGFGVLGMSNKTDGTYMDGPNAGVPGQQWWNANEPIRMFVADRNIGRRLLVVMLQESKPLVNDCLRQAGLSVDDVNYFACHQGFAWLRRATQQVIGLKNARACDSFTWAGSVLGCNIPLVMDVGLRENQLREGDVVATFSGAPGTVLSALVLRWGGVPGK
jgi:3-oxoacyl-[acyl-carrier-protein] synthase-3